MNSPDQAMIMQKSQEAIMNALNTYHTHLLQKHSLASQSPTDVSKLKQIMRSKSNVIKMSIQTGMPPPAHPATGDPELDICIQIILDTIHPPSFEKTELVTLANYWCDVIFEEYPLTLSTAHIQRLQDAANYKGQVDGEHTAPGMP
jgi:hypothetical protein